MEPLSSKTFASKAVPEYVLKPNGNVTTNASGRTAPATRQLAHLAQQSTVRRQPVKEYKVNLYAMALAKSLKGHATVNATQTIHSTAALLASKMMSKSWRGRKNGTAMAHASMRLTVVMAPATNPTGTLTAMEFVNSNKQCTIVVGYAKV